MDGRGMNSSRMSVASGWSISNSTVDLTYRDYFGPPKMTPFDMKMVELDFLKYQTKTHVKKLNSLKVKYIDWFSRRCQSFLDSVKLTQILAAKLVPGDLENMKDFQKVYKMSRRFPRNGTPRDNGPAQMDEFLIFWSEIVDLKETTDELYESVCKFCDSVTRLRHPAIKFEIDRLYNVLNVAYAEEFSFSDIKNERDNLFVYRVAPFDYRYHGLMGYIPHLHFISVRLLYWINRVHLEKE